MHETLCMQNLLQNWLINFEFIQLYCNLFKCNSKTILEHFEEINPHLKFKNNGTDLVESIQEA